MKELILYIAQSSICIAIFLLVYRLALRDTTFFYFNRIFLISGLIASFIIPAIHFSYEVILPTSISTSTENLETMQLFQQASSIDIWLVLSIIYITGISIQLIRNLASYRKMFKVIKSGQIT